MIILMTLLIAGASMVLAVHQWWRGYDIMAIGLITFALVMAGVAIEAGKDNQNAEAPEAFSGSLKAARRISELINRKAASWRPFQSVCGFVCSGHYLRLPFAAPAEQTYCAELPQSFEVASYPTECMQSVKAK